MKRFVQKGNKIVLKEDVEDKELDSKDILVNIGQLKGMIDKAGQDIEKSKKDVVFIESEVARLTPLLKDISKFQSWALKIQESKMKAFVDKLMVEGKNFVDKDYKNDVTMSPELNNSQRMVQLQNFIGRHPDVSKEIHADTIRKLIYVESIIVNPWV